MTTKTFKNSEELYKKALNSISGGVNSPVRSFNNVGGTPIFFESAKGAYLYDVDNNQFIDYVASWGPMILGHSAEITQRSIKEQVEKALSFGAPTNVEIELAEKIIDMVPSVEKVRMMNSGTEATMTAIRLCRGYTGKNLIIKFAGCYHGHSDALLAKAGSGVLTLGIPDSPGIPETVSCDTIVLPFNDPQAIKDTFEKYANQIACVIVEPVAGNMGCIPPISGYLELLREITLNHNSLLIFDEVMTGFRLAAGGAQEIYGVQPDLTTMGKIIGGGLPVGALGGNKEIMEYLAPLGPVYQAGTLSGNPLAMSAGLSVLSELDSEKYLYLKTQTDLLSDGLTELFTKHSIRASINKVCGMLSIFFETGEVTNYQQASQSNTELYKKFFYGMLEKGVYLAPSPYEVTFLSLCHSNEIIETTLLAAEDTLMQWSK
jgi:glutamate-1-semialdehyde 2,1-aminomutase